MKNNSERSLLSIILIPAILSNLVTVLRLVLELMGFQAKNPGQLTWWVSLSLLIPVMGLYFALSLRDTKHPFRRLPVILLMYAWSVRIPAAIVYGVSGTLGWHTHYSQWGPPEKQVGYLLGALLPQLVIWPIITLIGGSIIGVPTLLMVRSKKTPNPASI